MRTRFHRASPPTSCGRRVLTALVGGIDDSFVDLAAGDPSQLVRVVATADAEALEVGLLPLEPGAHPVEAMAGFTAPPNWLAIGVVSAGHSRSPGEPGSFGVDPEPTQPIRVTFLIDREGAAATALAAIGAPSAQRRLLHEPPAGLVADACRRVLGLPTAPPDEGPEVWLTTRWLDRLLAAAIEGPGAVTTWEAAARMHPLVGDVGGLAPTDLKALVVRTASRLGWEGFRSLATRRDGDGLVSPAAAAWMDSGSFARHLLAGELPVGLLLTELRALVPTVVMSAVREALPPSCREPSR